MSKRRRKKSTEENMFAVLMRSFHDDGSPIEALEEALEDPIDAARDPDAIDVEAQEVIDPTALPGNTELKALPAQVLPSDEIAAIEVTATEIEASPKPTSLIKGKVGRPRHPNPKPKNTNNGKRGRPATGKRSNNEWHGRTYYIRKQTDTLLESALFKLKRSGIEIDRSDLVDAFLESWSDIVLGKITDFQIGEIVKSKIIKTQPPEEPKE